MKNCIIVFGLTICSLQISFAQNLNEYTAPTEEHVLIDKTNISMIPPEGYIQHEALVGFLRPGDQTTMIQVQNMAGPYHEIIKGFTQNMMTPKGMTLHSKRPVKINGKDALVVQLEQDVNDITFFKTILVFGNEQSTTFVNGMCYIEDKELSELIKKSIESTIIGK